MSVVGLRNMCKPAMVYLIISLVAIMFMTSQQQYTDTNIFCMGSNYCNVSNGGVYIILVIKLLSVLFWTWILNIICMKVSPIVSWFLVLLPYIVWMAVLFYMFFFIR